MRKIFLVVFILFFSSCLTERKENKSEETIKDGLLITVEAIVLQDDIFSLMYLTKEKNFWNSENLIKSTITGGNVSQKIKFKFPKDIFPTKIRIDLGRNKQQKFIDLYKITFENKGERLTVEEKMINQYFITNKYAFFSENDRGDLSLSEREGEYNPLIITTDYFMNRLNLKLNKQ